MPNAQKFDYAINLLQDEVRAVRTEAARILSPVSDSFFSDSQRARFDEVYEELKARYTTNLDRAESHLSLGILSENQSNFIEAEKHYSCLLYTSPSPRDATLSRMPSSA